MTKLEILIDIIEMIQNQGLEGYEAQKLIIKAAQFGANIGNEKANNIALALYKNVEDNRQKVADKLTKAQLTDIADYIATEELKEVASPDMIAETNKEIIETHQYLSEVNRIWNTRRNTNSARFTNLVTGVLYGLGQDVSEVTGNCIKLKGKYVSELRHIFSVDDAKKLYMAVKQYDLTGGAER